MKNNLLLKIIGLAVFLCLSVVVQAQTKREIRVADGEPFTDHVSMKSDAKDMDVIVKFIFNEAENSLTVSMLSYRNLFVFHANVPYRQVVKCKKFRPERFPYVVAADEKVKYKLTKEMRRQIDGKKKKHVFKQWITYEGLQPQPVEEYRMVNDYIEQKFDIMNKENRVTVSLRDVLVMEPSASKKNRYDFIHYTHLDREYQVRIERNPCFGKEEELVAAEAMVESISGSYATLKQHAEGAEVMTRETVLLLDEMRVLLMDQFPKRKDSSPCPQVQGQIDLYNSYVDSIARMEEVKVAFEQKREVLYISAEHILSVARIIDNNVASWLVSTDVVEKNDLVKRNQKLIEALKAEIGEDKVMDSEQTAAYHVFLKAERYFNHTCIPNKKKQKSL